MKFSFAEKTPPSSKDENKATVKKRNYISCCLQVTAFIIVLPLVLYAILTALGAASPSIALQFGQATADFQYPIQRVIRFMSLPMHRFFDLSKLSAWDCLIDNPLFIPGIEIQLYMGRGAGLGQW